MANLKRLPVFAALAILLLTAAWIGREAPPAPAPAAPRAVTASDGRVRYPEGHIPQLSLPGGGTRPVRSVLDITKPMRFGDYVWNEAGIAPGPVWVRIDLARQILSVFRGGHEIGTAVILYGTDGKPTPTGTFPILARARDHASTLYDAQMPYMLRLTGDGVAIHASHVRRGYATHGCIGVPLDFAAKLYAATKVGDEVAILPAHGQT